MTKKGATILALATTFFYFIVSIVVMLVYKGESGVMEKNDQFLIFLLIQAPRIIFLFGLTVYFLVLSALPIERKKNGRTSNSGTRKTTTTKATTKPSSKTSTQTKPTSKDDSKEDGE